MLLAQYPLESHSRGIITVASMLRDAGMEVIFIGNELPERIVDTAIQEDVDVIGISTYCGGEMAPSIDLMKAAEAKGIKSNTVFLIGGIFPPNNASKLKEMGFYDVFPPLSTREEIVSCIKTAVDTRRPGSESSG